MSTDNLPIKNCPLAFKCEKKWRDLSPVASSPSGSEIRFCSSCDKKVYQCVNYEELQEHKKHNRCVMIDRTLWKFEYELLGRPEPDSTNNEFKALFYKTEKSNMKSISQKLMTYIKSFLSAKP